MKSKLGGIVAASLAMGAYAQLMSADSRKMRHTGEPRFPGMKIGGKAKHFNKKRHGKSLRRKHARP